MEKEKPESFQLSAPPSHLMDLETAARSFGVTRQAFHRWNVAPVRAEGTRRLFNFAAVIDNRLQAAQEANTPADAEIDRLEARIALLREQIEHQRIRNQDTASEFVPAGAAESAMRAILSGIAEIVSRIPDDLDTEFPKVRAARELIDRQTQRSIEALRAAELETLQSEPEE